MRVRGWGLAVLAACAAPVDGPDRSGSTTAETSDASVEPPEWSPTGDSGTPTDAFACPCPESYVADDVLKTTNGSDEAMVYGPYGDDLRDELFVFLHGSGQSPAIHSQILRTAAYAGYRVIAVQYSSLPQILEVCADEADFDGCTESLRQTRIYGEEHQEYGFVPDEASIVGRVHGWLTELHALEPDAGWDAWFVPAEGVTDHERYLRWDKIVIGGFSQGAGHAAMLARDFATEGVFLLSNPADGEVSWIRPGATAACTWTGFHHTEESFAEEIAAAFTTFGVPDGASRDPAALIGDTCFARGPYGGAQRFEVSLRPASCVTDTPEHGSMGNDDCLNVAEAPPGDPYTLFRPYLYAMCVAADRDPLATGDCPTLSF